MYKKYNANNDYSEWEKEYTVYRCKRDISCGNGIFESGSFVMLQVFDADFETICVSDFTSVCTRVKNNPVECDYVNDPTTEVLCDVAVIAPSEMHDYFETADEVNRDLEKVKKAKKTAAIITLIFFILLVLSVFAAISYSKHMIEAIIGVIAVTYLGGYLIYLKNISNQFCIRLCQKENQTERSNHNEPESNHNHGAADC